jgi:predicted alpha/beta hydrolase
MNSVRSISIQTKDGWILRGDVLSEGTKSGPVVILLHAMMASRKTMDRPRGKGLGTVLAERGFGVVAIDLRGHGESGPNAREGARFTYDDYVLRDVPACIARARKTFPERKIVVVGHSLGAHATVVASGVFPDESADAVVSIAGNMWLPSWEPNRFRKAKKTANLLAFLKIAETWGYFDARALRMGTDPIALPYVQQFWDMWSADRYGSVDGAIDYQRALERVAIPVLSVASEGDELLAHPVSVEFFMRAIPERFRTSRVYGAKDVGGRAPDHMGLVTNPISRVIWNDIADWIERQAE